MRCLFKHHWESVAYDGSFYFSFYDKKTGDTEKSYFPVIWQKCSGCGRRRLYRKFERLTHDGADFVNMIWKEKNIISGTKNTAIFDENYEYTSVDNRGMVQYVYRPVTDTGKLFRNLQKNLENQGKMEEQAVKDALTHLKMVLDIYSNND